MADNKIPFGGHDWNKDGKYDNFDRMKDFYVYKKVTEDWEKNGAGKKEKKPPVNDFQPQKTKETQHLENMILLIGLPIVAVLAICVIMWAIEKEVLSGLIALVVIVILLGVIL